MELTDDLKTIFTEAVNDLKEYARRVFMARVVNALGQQFPFCSRDFQIACIFPRKAPCAIAKSRLRPDFSPITGIAGFG
ncbi:MAG: hypothetical protein DRJ03_10435 [Chloroflexi bacterium]|nr:MAG: hypothetical protein DRI81_07705 [Chloroflexota bacterium]RLC85853.1 MAG: hypothetical protein DRJ03_10435 [Chloroflexota bacterium]HEY72845.1 hypothetical protein [Thermoflexia bacterium]